MSRIDGNDAGAGEGDAGVTPGGCGNGPACSDRTIAGRPIERCVDGECRQSCIGDRMCRGDTPICVEVADESGEVGRSCMPAECQRTNDCDEGQVCESSRCRDATFCDGDSDCAASELCNGEGVCVERDGCLVDDDCEVNGTCNDGYCYAAQRLQRSGALRRRAGLRGGSVRRGDLSKRCGLRTGSTCGAGQCVEAPAVEPHRIVIVTPYGVCAGGSENACRLPLALGAGAQPHGDGARRQWTGDRWTGVRVVE